MGEGASRQGEGGNAGPGEPEVQEGRPGQAGDCTRACGRAGGRGSEA